MKRSRRAIGLPASLAALAACLAGCAGSGLPLVATRDMSPQALQRFEAIDANRDGLIRAHETWSDPYVEARARYHDADHNGALDEREFQALLAAPQRARQDSQ